MSFLSAYQVDRMRAAAAQTLPDELTILRESKSYDDAGGYDEVFTEIDTIPARIGLPLGGESDVRAETTTRIADEDLYTAWVAAETDIRKEDRVVWENRIFEVYVVLQRGLWEIARRVRLKEL